METIYRPVWAEINLSSVKHNCEMIRSSLAAHMQICADVAANAYGHGVLEISLACIEAGVEYLSVATVEEGIELRNARVTVPIFITGWVSKNDYDLAITYSLCLPIRDIGEAVILSEKALNSGKKASCHLNIDFLLSSNKSISTNLFKTLQAIVQLKNLSIKAFTCCISVWNESVSSVIKQLNIFKWKMLKFTGCKLLLFCICKEIHLIDSQIHNFDIVDISSLLYGHNSGFRNNYLTLQSVLKWKAKIVHTKWLPAGRYVGYNGTYKLDKETYIATIPVGYADGYNRLLSNKGHVVCKKMYLPIIGRICMDQFMVDATLIPSLTVGDEVLLLGEEHNNTYTVVEMANTLNTVADDITCRISKRVPRVYVK